MSLKASALASLGKLNGENSMAEKLSEIMIASYNSHGEDNKSLKLSTLVMAPDLHELINYIKSVGFHLLGRIFYIEVTDLIWSGGRVARSNLKERRHLKEQIGGGYKNSGSPNGRKSWGDGGLVVTRRGKLKLNLVKGSRGISTNNSLPAGFEKLGNLSNLNTLNSTFINTKVLDVLCDIDILIAAYTKLKSYSGNMTPGLDAKTPDGIDLPWFKRLKKDLHTNRFQFRPTRSLDILKKNGKGTRPLGIASPRDKIVLGAMLLVLEAIFEPTLSTHSHGYRPKRGCHSALGEIKRTYTSVN